MNRIVLAFLLLLLWGCNTGTTAMGANRAKKSVTVHDITVQWKFNGDAKGFYVFRGTSSDNYEVKRQVPMVYRYTYTNCKIGQTYYFRVKAIKPDGSVTNPSPEVRYKVQ